MRETEFFKLVFFNIPGILGGVALILIAVTICLGVRHRHRLAEEDMNAAEDTTDGMSSATDEAAVREIGLSSAGLGNSHYTSKTEKPPKA